MKICHITTMHPVFDTRIFKKECVSLVKSGHKVTLIAPHSSREVVAGVYILPIRSQRSFLDRLYHLPKHVMTLLTKVKADIYHFHDPELLPFMYNFSSKGHKVVWDAHENYRDTIQSFNSLQIKPLSRIGARIFEYMEMKASNSFAGVVTITEKMAKKYLDEGIRTCVLGNYADLEYFRYRGENYVSRIPRLISSGAHFRARAITEIARSFAFIKEKIDAELFFSGKFTDPNLEVEVKAIAKQVDKEGNCIKFEGEMNFDDLINKSIPRAWVGTVLFDTSDPNNRNGLPNRLFECWANGVPVITTAGTQVAEMVKQHGGGVVIPSNDPRKIAQAFLSIVSNKEYRDQLSKEAYLTVRRDLNWNTAFRNLLDLYSEIQRCS